MVKQMLRHPLVMPRATILDPAITVHTPEWLFLSTGIRAVDHCVEGICSREAHPYADAQAMKGLAMLAQGLPRVKADPARSRRADGLPDRHLALDGAAVGRRADGREPRHRLCAGWRPIDVPHGYTSCVMLPAVMRWNKSRQRRAAGAGRGRHGASGQGCRRRAGRFHSRPRHAAQPADVRVGPEHFDAIAEQAMRTPWVPRNPRKIDGPAQVREILLLAA